MKKQQKKNLDLKEGKQQHDIILQKPFLQFLKEWFTWQKVGVILTGLSVVVTVLIYYASITDSGTINIVKEEIRQNIELIENTFNPEDLPRQDSLAADFQRISLRLASLWKINEEEKAYQPIVDKGVKVLEQVLDQEFARENKYNDTMLAFILKCKEIRNKETVSDSHSIISDLRLIEMTDALKLKNKVAEKYRNKSLNYMNKATNSSNKKQIYRNISKSMKEIDNMKQDPQYYELDKQLFKFIIETNNLLTNNTIAPN